MKNLFFIAFLILLLPTVHGQFWMTAGTTMNETKSFEMVIGGWTDVKDESVALPRIEGYVNFGIGEGDFEMMGAKYYSNVTQAEASGWGDSCQ